MNPIVLSSLIPVVLLIAIGFIAGSRRRRMARMVVGALRNGILHPVPLPIGANVFMFSQRYEVAQELVTAGVAVSTVLGVVTISVVMGVVGWV